MDIIEAVMFLGGIYCIITAKVPAFLVGGGFYKVDKWLARSIGVLLLIPLAIATFNKNFPVTDQLSIEIGSLFVIGVLVLVLTRVVGKPIETTSDIEATIAKKTQRALSYAIMSPVFFVIFLPVSLINANQALNLIDQHHRGEQYRGRAKASRLIAIALSLISITGCLIWAWVFSL